MSSEFGNQESQTRTPSDSPPRRLIGRRFDDPTVKKDIESWPFKVVDDNGSPKVSVEYLGEEKTFSPQEISAMILVKVRRKSIRYGIGQDLTIAHR